MKNVHRLCWQVKGAKASRDAFERALREGLGGFGRWIVAPERVVCFVETTVPVACVDPWVRESIETALFRIAKRVGGVEVTR